MHISNFRGNLSLILHAIINDIAQLLGIYEHIVQLGFR